MSTEVTLHDSVFSRENLIAAAWADDRERTDWAGVLANAVTLDAGEIVAAIKRLEPVSPSDPVATGKVWGLQQKLRLAVRVKAGKPLVNESEVCGACGRHHPDPVMKVCLACSEEEELRRNLSWGFHGMALTPMFDAGSNSWGIVYEYHRGHRDDFAFWLARGYASRADASRAALAPVLFVQMADRLATEGLGYSLDTLLSLDRIFSAESPFTPEGWKAFMSDAMRKLQPENGWACDRAVNAAIDDHFREMKGE